MLPNKSLRLFVRNLLSNFCRSYWTSCYDISNTFKLVKLFGLFAFPALLQAISHVVNDGRMSGVSLTSSFDGNLSLGDGRCRIVGCSCFVLFFRRSKRLRWLWRGVGSQAGETRATCDHRFIVQISDHTLIFLPLIFISGGKIYVIREGVKNNW